MVMNIPTICLLMMHWKSCSFSPSPQFCSFKWYIFWGSALLSSSSIFIGLLLLRVAPIREFHFVEVFLFWGPNTFAAFKGTISWNLVQHKMSMSEIKGIQLHQFNVIKRSGLPQNINICWIILCVEPIFHVQILGWCNASNIHSMNQQRSFTE